MKKRFLSLLCALAFVLPFIAATPCFAATSETTIDQITYQYDTETGEAVVTGAASDIFGDVEIPGTKGRSMQSLLSGIARFIGAPA